MGCRGRGPSLDESTKSLQVGSETLLRPGVDDASILAEYRIGR